MLKRVLKHSNKLNHCNNSLKTTEKQAQEQLKAQQKVFSIDKALSEAGAKNNKAVEALLDADAIELDDKGTLNGLAEQLEKLQADDNYEFLV